MWSVQTGKLLDVLTGHTAPISSLAFAPLSASTDHLASASWDGTVRIWSVFGRSRATEPFQLGNEVLSVAYRPDGKEMACSTLDGNITFFDIAESRQTSVIEGRKDVSGGRLQDDKMTATNNASTKYFNSLAYTADGTCLIAGGSSKYVLIYDIQDGVAVKKFQISENLSLDGTQEFLDSRRMTEAGVSIEALDLRGDEEDLNDRVDITLPGAQKGDLSRRKYRRAARTMCVRFSPTGRTWAAASTEGLLLYGLDETTTFDPLDLDIDITPESLLETIEEGDHLMALIMAFRLNEQPLILRAYEAVPWTDIKLIARQVPQIYLLTLLRFIAGHMQNSPHVEFDLTWSQALMTAHGRFLASRSSEFASVFRSLQRSVSDFEHNISKM